MELYYSDENIFSFESWYTTYDRFTELFEGDRTQLHFRKVLKYNGIERRGKDRNVEDFFE